MENMNDRWDLSYLYPDFDDEQFKADLASLKGEAEKAAYLNVPTPCGKDADSGKGTAWPGFPEAAPAMIEEILP